MAGTCWSRAGPWAGLPACGPARPVPYRSLPRPATAAGGTGANFGTFREHTFTDSNFVSYISVLTGAGITSANDYAIFEASSGTADLLQEGDPAPGVSATIKILYKPATSELGHTYFPAHLTVGSGGGERHRLQRYDALGKSRRLGRAHCPRGGSRSGECRARGRSHVRSLEIASRRQRLRPGRVRWTAGDRPRRRRRQRQHRPADGRTGGRGNHRPGGRSCPGFRPGSVQLL